MNRILDNNFDSIIYISHPFSGENNNLERIGLLIKLLQNKYPNYLFISPVHMFGHLYHSTTYEDGIRMCLWALEKCDEMWVFGDWENSNGCKIEMSYCNEYLIPYKVINIEDEFGIYLDKRFKFKKGNKNFLLPNEIALLNKMIKYHAKEIVIHKDNSKWVIFSNDITTDDYWMEFNETAVRLIELEVESFFEETFNVKDPLLSNLIIAYENEISISSLEDSSRIILT